MLTSKTISWLVWRIENDLPELFNRLPKNNDRHPDTRADYRRMILSDKLENFDIRYKDTLVKLIQSGDEKGVWQMIFGLEFVDDEPYMIAKNK